MNRKIKQTKKIIQSSEHFLPPSLTVSEDSKYTSEEHKEIGVLYYIKLYFIPD